MLLSPRACRNLFSVEVDCGIGDDNELNCTNTDGAPSSCPGNDPAWTGSEYRREDQVYQPHECEAVSSCNKLLQ